MNSMSNAPDKNDQVQYCQVTHCFHPLYGKKIQIALIRQNWGEDRVYYRHGDGSTRAISASWTSVYDPDVFNIVSDGRSSFRFKELLELTRLVDELLSEGH